MSRRPIIVVGLLLTAVVGLAACSSATGQNPSAATASSSPSTKATAAATVARLDRKAACAEYLAGQIELMTKELEAMPSIEEAITDPAKKAKLVQEVKAVTAKFKALVDRIAAATSDGELKVALSFYSEHLGKELAAVEAAGTDTAKAMLALEGTDEARSAGEMVRQLCH